MSVPALLTMFFMSVASAPGTGTVTLGSVVTGGYLSASDAGAVDGGIYSYAIIDGTSREECWGQYSASAGTLTRNTIIASVNGIKQTTPITASSSARIAGTATPFDVVTPARMMGGFVNKFRNATMDVARRGTGNSAGNIVTTAPTVALDGWILYSNHTATWSQILNGNFFGNALRWASNLSTNTIGTVRQKIENCIAARLATGDPITVQFTIYNNCGQTVTPTLYTGYPTTTNTFGSPSAWDVLSSGCTADLASVTLQSIPNGATVTVAYTFVPSANIANGYEIVFQFSTTATSGYLDFARPDVRLTPGLPVGLCANPPPPELRPFSIEDKFCKRYFRTSYPNGIAPGTSMTTMQGMVFGYFGSTASVTYGIPHLFDVEMASTPTLSTWDAVGNSGAFSYYYSGAQTDNVAFTGTFVVSAKGIICKPPAGLAKAGNYHYSASAEL